MEKEISETYYFNPADFDNNGRRLDDGMTFRDIVKGYERDFHEVHSAEYALNLYANSNTMSLLAKSNDAAPFLIYGLELTQGRIFDTEKDPEINREMEKHSDYIYVYGIDSAFMTMFDKFGFPIVDEEHGICPLTLLVDDKMMDGSVRLSAPTMDNDDDEQEPVTVDVPKCEYC